VRQPILAAAGFQAVLKNSCDKPFSGRTVSMSMARLRRASEQNGYKVLALSAQKLVLKTSRLYVRIIGANTARPRCRASQEREGSYGHHW
jgi:hypothetical protein